MKALLFSMSFFFAALCFADQDYQIGHSVGKWKSIDGVLEYNELEVVRPRPESYEIDLKYCKDGGQKCRERIAEARYLEEFDCIEAYDSDLEVSYTLRVEGKNQEMLVRAQGDEKIFFFRVE